ncbi:hypothetical protein FRB99_000807 [Tulasnella sp. 403]|nr:hypothetical protein FRB99_000807 [Tulasnella sp. 403]
MLVASDPMPSPGDDFDVYTDDIHYGDAYHLLLVCKAWNKVSRGSVLMKSLHIVRWDQLDALKHRLKAFGAEGCGWTKNLTVSLTFGSGTGAVRKSYKHYTQALSYILRRLPKLVSFRHQIIAPLLRSASLTPVVDALLTSRESLRRCAWYGHVSPGVELEMRILEGCIRLQHFEDRSQPMDEGRPNPGAIVTPGGVQPIERNALRTLAVRASSPALWGGRFRFDNISYFAPRQTSLSNGPNLHSHFFTTIRLSITSLSLHSFRAVPTTFLAPTLSQCPNLLDLTFQLSSEEPTTPETPNASEELITHQRLVRLGVLVQVKPSTTARHSFFRSLDRCLPHFVSCQTRLPSLRTVRLLNPETELVKSLLTHEERTVHMVASLGQCVKLVGGLHPPWWERWKDLIERDELLEGDGAAAGSVGPTESGRELGPLETEGDNTNGERRREPWVRFEDATGERIRASFAFQQILSPAIFYRHPSYSDYSD